MDEFLEQGLPLSIRIHHVGNIYLMSALLQFSRLIKPEQSH